MSDPYPTVVLNGEFLSQSQASLSIFDRGFLYGDGVFETIRVCRGRLFRWPDHVKRLMEGIAYLRIKFPFSAQELHVMANGLLRRHETTEAILRVAVSRGVGARGYSTRGVGDPTLVMSLHPAEPIEESKLVRWKFHVAQNVHQPTLPALAAHKSSNKLLQILAKTEAEEAGADEALLLNEEGYLVEAATGNLFWIQDDTICSPPLAGSGILPGVTRQAVLEICQQQRWTTRESLITPEQFRNVEGAFITLSSLGIVEVASVDGHNIPTSPPTLALQRALVEAMNNPIR